MALEVHPSVIANFPILVIASAIAISCLVAYSRVKGKEFRSTVIGRLAGRLKLILIIVYGGQFGLMMLIAIVGVATNSDLLIPAWEFSKLSFHTSLAILVGATAGFILVAMFYGRGVSAFLLSALLMTIIPLVVISYDIAVPAIEISMNFLDTIGFMLLILLSSSENWLVGKILGIREADSSAKERAIWIIALRYSIKVFEKLQRRVGVDEDERAARAIELLLDAEGVPRGMLREAAIHAGIVESNTEGIEVPAVPTIPVLRGQMPIPQPREPNPSGEWTLTDREFKQMVNLDRRAFAVLMAVSIFIVYQAALSPNSSLGSWTILLVGGFASISLLACRWDKTFMGERMSSDEIYELIILFYAGLDEITSEHLSKPVADGTTLPEHSAEIVTSPSEERLLTQEIIQLQNDETQDFLERVQSGSRQIYRESLAPEYTAIAGIALCMPSAMVLFLAYLNGATILVGPALLVLAIGIIVIIAGAHWWNRLTTERSFAGTRRGWLSVALSYLDISESGIEDPGYIMFPRAPTQALAFIQLGGPATAARLMKSRRKREALASKVDPDDATSIEMRSVIQQYEISKGVLCILPLVLVLVVMISFMPFGIGGTMFPLLALLVVSVGLMMLWPVSLYRKKTAAEEYFADRPDDLTKRKPVVSDLLQEMVQSYRYPIVLLVMRNHPQLYYTGKSYLTSNDATLLEAVFLPK